MIVVPLQQRVCAVTSYCSYPWETLIVVSSVHDLMRLQYTFSSSSDPVDLASSSNCLTNSFLALLPNRKVTEVSKHRAGKSLAQTLGAPVYLRIWKVEHACYVQPRVGQVISRRLLIANPALIPRKPPSDPVPDLTENSTRDVSVPVGDIGD